MRGAVFLLVLCASACAPVVDRAIEDAALTAAVTTALLNNPDIDGTLVSVRTQTGVVRIDGTQPSAEAAARVESIVRSVPGVRDVQSAVVVAAGPPPERRVP